MQTIYIDVLIVLNLYVNFFLLKATAKITHSPLGIRRCLAASAAGSLFSLMILAPELGIILGTAVKLGAALIITAIAFGLKNRKRIIPNLIVFFAANYVLAGAVCAFYSWLAPGLMHFNNTYFYIDFSLVILIFTTAAIYFSICGFRYFFDRMPQDCESYRIIIRYKGRLAAMDGLADSGNLLVDYFSGSPVIVCGMSRLSGILEPSDITEQLPKGFRILPCSTVNSSGAITVFRPDEIVITELESGLRRSVEALVGISSETEKAVFNPKILKN
ncbi:MAG: sigma-E processing peptidase SpoIIGA [Oscillospiraceae bacterium]|nr:sigma-E processing peptidase SpoIIGA [Oscillospiraceae bacterium]